jgi:hypothetical protein
MFASLAAARSELDAIALGFDASAFAGNEALRVVAELGAISRVVDGMLAKTAKRVADTSAHAAQGDRNAASAVARSLGVGAGEVRAAMETAAKLEKLPVTDAAVREGNLSSLEAQMIADAATVNPQAEQDLLEAARHGLVPLKDACIAARARTEAPKDRTKRQHAARRFRMWTDDDGMVAGRFRVTPEVGGQMKVAIDSAVQRTFRSRRTGSEHEPHEAYAADALAAFVLAGKPGSAAGGAQATVHIVVDHATLVLGGTVDGGVCEIPGVGPVSVEWVRELLGSAFLTAVIKKGKDIVTVAHLGRHVPAEIQTALIVSGRECDVAGCHHRGYLERDHVHDHAKGGPTAFWNLGWLCYWHHRLKSAGWQLGERDPVTRKRKLHEPLRRRRGRVPDSDLASNRRRARQFESGTDP